MSATGSEAAMAFRRAARGYRSAVGFSLLEMLLVVLLLGLMATMTAVSVRRGLSGARAQSAASELATGLRRARMQAVARGHQADFRLDLRQASYRIGEGPARALPKDLQLGMRYAGEVVRHPAIGEGGIRFFPDGSSSGGRITLRQGHRHWQLDVSWLTGAVTVSSAQVEP